MKKHKAKQSKSFKPLSKFYKRHRLLSLIVIIAAFLVGGWFFVGPSLFSPAGINEISPDQAILIEKQRSLPAGCRYEKIQCISAPCQDRIVCDSPAPTKDPGLTPDPMPPAMCAKDLFQCADGTQVSRTGPNCEFVCPKPSPSASCIPQPECRINGTCPTYKMDARYCGYKPTPTPTCKPQPTCAPGARCAYITSAEYCPVKPTPTPTCIPVPTCRPDGVCPVYKMDARYCGYRPTPTPSPKSGYIMTFSAARPCGYDSFQEYSYTCKNGIKSLQIISGCQSLQNAMTKVLKACSEPLYMEAR